MRKYVKHLEHGTCSTNTDFLPTSMNIDSIWQHYVGYQYVAKNQVRLPVSMNLSPWLHTLSHRSFLCIYLCAFKDHFYKLFQPWVQKNLPGIYNCFFVWKNQHFSKFHLKMFLWVIVVKFGTNVRCHQISQVWNIFWLRKKGSILKFFSILDFLMFDMQVGRCTGCFVLLLLIIQIIPFYFPLKMEINLKFTLISTTDG